MLLPINTQPAMVTVNLATFPTDLAVAAAPAAGALSRAAERIAGAERIVIKVGGGGNHFGEPIRALAERSAPRWCSRRATGV